MPTSYLDLYRTDQGKKLLAPLGEQVDYIFVTQQVVGEVQRNKILVAAGFLSQKFKGVKLQSFNVPDHLSGTSTGQGKEILQQMSEIGQKIKKVNDEVDALALGILEQISYSEDEVSKALSPIFASAAPHSPEELQRARDRRELGNPPGKSTNPIGDQLTWEQILTCFKGKKRLWIISRDGDYGTVYGGKGFLNHFLYDELCKVADKPEVYLFEDTVEGIGHFVDTTGVKAEKRLTPEEAEEIEKEERSLPDLSQPSKGLSQIIAEVEQLRQPSKLSQIMAEIEQLRQPSKGLSQMVSNLYQPSAPTHQFLKGDQEEKDEQPSISSPPSQVQKENNEEKKDEEGKTE
jgi:PIN domain